ncbi:hypothetical protein DCAR_0103969 [Daucus carota subsp. sativus]|uniref:Uncharacterized protein n=1 Tax=Daucus carota subsp. sativus TaxID=79200 RepID=A0A166IFL3_DAUCS|nr:hypothetical protein DCAR_0103969 [Daucus carota subsp. sativus]
MAKESSPTLNKIMTNFSCFILASTTLFFFMLTVIISPTQHTLPPSTMKSLVAESNVKSFKEDGNAQQNVSITGRRGGPCKSVKWRERINNANAHEVPSGPNPISNR